MRSGPVAESLHDLVGEVARVSGGAVATYIPELAAADPEAFGISLVSMDGHRYASGDAAARFTIQSVSKPFVYALAVSELGLDDVARWVGAEPSGEAFNAASFDPVSGRPANPMINAGAIVTSGLVPGVDAIERMRRILAVLSGFAGRVLDIDEAVYASEAATGDRNRALAYLAQAAGRLPVAVEEAVDVYFRQCAVRVDCADVALMAATLANGGVNPVTGVQVVPEPAAVAALSVMATCGMYDASGDWLLRVGLPAKSGVSGGVLAVSPARFGIAVYSPPVDAQGNSVRGVAALRRLSARFGLHLLHHVEAVGIPVSVSGDGGVPCVAVRGRLDFTVAERLLFALGEVAEAGRSGGLVVDLSQVTAVEPIARAMLTSALAASGRVAVVGGDMVGGPWPTFATAQAAAAFCRS